MIAGRDIENRRYEDGFTLIELIITVAVTGIVMACISTAVVMTMRIGPSVKDRSTFSGGTAFLVSSISDDVANSSAVTPPAPGGMTCTPGASVDLGHITLLSGTAVAYTAAISDEPAATVDGNDIYEVDVTRSPSANDVALTGYCTDGASLGDGVTFSDPTYTLDLALQVAPDADVRDVSLSAARRTKLATGFTLSGSVYNDINGNATKDGGESALTGASWQIVVWSSDLLTVKATMNPNASGAFSTALAVGTYVACPSVINGNWGQSTPAAVGSGVVTCGNGNLGWVVSPAYYTSVDFGMLFTGASCVLLMTRTVDLTRSTGGPGTPGKPANYSTVQSAYDAAKVSGQAEVVGLYSNTTENDVWDGAKAMTINQCSGAGGTITAASNASPAIKITNTQKITAVSPVTVGGSIGWEVASGGHDLKSIRANSSQGPGVKIDSGANNNTINWNALQNNVGVGIDVNSTGNTLSGGSTGVSSNAGGGVHFASGANNNTLTGGAITGNSGYGVYIESNGNTIDGPDVSTSGGYGVWVTGNNNTVKNMTSNSNTSHGIYLVGSNTTLTKNTTEKNSGDGINVANSASGTNLGQNKSNTGASAGPKENTGAEYRFGTSAGTDQGSNKADNANIPAAGKCPTFPAASSVCE